jgi:ABC-type transporter Mla MlaB component
VQDPGARSVVIVVQSPVSRADIPGICARIRGALAAGTGDRLVCDVSGLDEVDAVVVDALARVQLTVRRLGGTLELRGADADLVALLAWMGLAHVIGGGGEPER